MTQVRISDEFHATVKEEAALHQRTVAEHLEYLARLGHALEVAGANTRTIRSLLSFERKWTPGPQSEQEIRKIIDDLSSLQGIPGLAAVLEERGGRVSGRDPAELEQFLRGTDNRETESN